MSDRRITRKSKGMPTQDGAGVSLSRIIGNPNLQRLDPFLMLDEFKSDDPNQYIAGFPFHPHRGFETVTYLLAGSVRIFQSRRLKRAGSAFLPGSTKMLPAQCKGLPLSRSSSMCALTKRAAGNILCRLVTLVLCMCIKDVCSWGKTPFKQVSWVCYQRATI